MHRNNQPRRFNPDQAIGNTFFLDGPANLVAYGAWLKQIEFNRSKHGPKLMREGCPMIDLEHHGKRVGRVVCREPAMWDTALDSVYQHQIAERVVLS